MCLLHSIFCCLNCCFHIRSMEVLTKSTQQKETADFLKVLLMVINNHFDYYIDKSVLVENRPLVKFIQTTLGTRVAHILTGKDLR